ncbi:3D domain-containing protein [Clostridium sp. OS1-26]|uniref:3D domain-containing protein n=1 Tax=Clostridium sp. OS1-26 TaxID=3070681 RepID=UPI0027DF120D|nr:3D domain-containing protein [Clostridium sp. OS1-26]WML34164.1 3D domain-containing protein [Clostridium sp. OS1-26]
MSTNVKKVMLTILIIIDIIAIRYANVYSKDSFANQIYNNIKSNQVASIDALKNINTKNIDQYKQTEIKREPKQEVKNQPEQISVNKDSNSQSEQNKITEDNNRQSDLNKDEEKNDEKNKENNPSDKKQLSRGSSLGVNSLGYETDITLTFYTSLAEENGGYADITCTGGKLTPGMVANNVLPLGTEIYTSEFGTLTVSDRGGNNFNTIHRLDVFISRK